MKKSKIKIVPFDKGKSLSEIYQTSKLTFAFVSAPKDGNRQCHQFVKCRDFLQDALRTALTGNTTKIYGFEFDKAKNPPIDFRRTRMLVRSKRKLEENEKVINQAIKLLNHYEHMIGVVPSSVSVNEDDYLFSSPSFWMSSPALISLYTLLIRLGEYDLDFTIYDNTSLLKAYETLTKTTKTDNEVSYLRTVKDYIHKVIVNSHYIFEKNAPGKFDKLYFKDISISTFHNYSGIVGLCQAVDTSQIHHENYKRLQDTLKEDVLSIADLPVVVCDKQYGINNYYSPNSWNFSLVSIKENEISRVLQHFVTCREQLTRYASVLAEKTDFDKLSLIAAIPGVFDDSVRMQKHKKEIFLAKRVINFFETTCGVKKSTISSVCLRITNSNRKHYAWVFNGNPIWANNPVMLSLYVIIVRAVAGYCSYSGKDHKEVDEKVVKDIFAFRKGKGTYENKDWVLLDTYYEQIKTILLNSAKLFGDKSAKHNYILGPGQIAASIYGGSFYNNIGINSLLTGKHADKKLQSSFKGLQNAKA